MAPGLILAYGSYQVRTGHSRNDGRKSCLVDAWRRLASGGSPGLS